MEHNADQENKAPKTAKLTQEIAKTQQQNAVNQPVSSRDGMVAQQQAINIQLFLDGMAEYGNVKDACKAAGIAYQTYYNYKASGLLTQEDINIAFAQHCDLIRGEYYNRAVRGEKVPLIHYGRQMIDAQGNPMYITVKSDRLLESYAKYILGWNDTQHIDLTTHDNPDDNIPAQFRLTFDARELTESEWHTIRSIAENIESRKADKA